MAGDFSGTGRCVKPHRQRLAFILLQGGRTEPPANFPALSSSTLRSGSVPAVTWARRCTRDAAICLEPLGPNPAALDRNQRAPAALWKQPVAHIPLPCSAGHPGRSREWLRPCYFATHSVSALRGKFRLR